MLKQPYWVAFVFLVLIILIVFEYLDHDCLPHKQCYHRVASPQPDDSIEEILISLQEMLRSNHDFVIWRQALIAAIAAGILIVIFLYARFPRPLELLFIGLIIFLGVYFSLSWMRTHFHAPNNWQIRQGLFLLDSKIKKL